MKSLTTYTKILKALMSNQSKGPKELAIEIDRQPGTVANALVYMNQTNLITRTDYGKYTITDMGRKELARISQPPTDQSCGGTEQ